MTEASVMHEREKFQLIELSLQKARARATMNLELWHAAEGGDIELLIQLLHLGADVNAIDLHSGYTALIRAAKAGHADVCQHLLKRGADTGYLSKYHGTALHMAAQHGYEDVCEALLQHGADVNALGGYLDCAPLHLAASHGQLLACIKLLEHGADSAVKNHRGQTAIHVAAERGFKEIAIELLSRSTSGVGNEDKSRRAPLHLAACGGHVDLCTTLLDHGARIEDLDGKNRNALHYAASYGHHDACLALIELGADMHQRDFNNETPLDRAVTSNRTKAELLLIIKGASRGGTPRILRKLRSDRLTSPLEASAKLGNDELLVETLKNDAEPGTLAARIAAAIPLARRGSLTEHILRATRGSLMVSRDMAELEL